MTLGSLFDGSGGFPLAGLMCGIKPLWASEIEPYPIAVTRERLPFMQHLGSVLDLKGGEIPPVDVITFGSPCQDLSVAGKRAGIHDGARSNLFFEAIRVIREMREKTNGRYPTFILWENVPGAFSSSNGDDFRCVLEAIAQTADAAVAIPKPAKWQHAGEVLGDGYSIAWRMLDAQYWGVPQRRKRIYLVADFAGGRAGKILFERDGLQGDYQTRGKAGQDTAEDAERRAGKRDSGVLNAYGINWRNNGLPDMVKEKTPTLCSTDYKCPQGVMFFNNRVVRRLTPLECNRLQGFPDDWGSLEHKDALTDEEAEFWEHVRKVHADANGKKYRPLKREVLVKWYNGLSIDSNQYKMWGNGIALPCALFVMEGIAKELRSPDEV